MSLENVGKEIAKARAEAEEKQSAAKESGKAAPRKVRGFPFKSDCEGIHRRVTDDDGTRWVRFGSPLEVVAVTRDAEGGNHGRLIVLTDLDGVRKEWPMPAALLGASGEAIRSELLALGWVPDMAAGRKWREWLLEYLIMAAPEVRARCVSSIGWHGTSFVLPDRTFAPSAMGEVERVILQGVDHVGHAFGVSGTLAEWQEHIARPALGNSRLVLAIATAFASPLLAVSGDDGGGFHFRGCSSMGKSTALYVAGSVWGGGGAAGYVRNWRATDNALEAVAALHNGPVLLLDELSQVEPKAAGAAAYMLANGLGKARAGKEGQARRGYQWRLLFVSTGEIALADKVREGGGQMAAGMEVRVIDLRADAGAGLGLFENIGDAPDAASFAQRLREASGRFYGEPARAFLSLIVEDLPRIRDELKAARRAFVNDVLPGGADGQVRRVCDRFALVAASGDLASALGVTGWPVGSAREAVARCFRDWLKERGGAGSGEVAEAKRRLAQALEAYGASRFQKFHMNADRAVITPRWGFVKMRDEEEGGPLEDRTWFFLSGALREVLAGLDFRAMVAALMAEGVIVAQGKSGAPSKTFHVPNDGRKHRLFQINADALLGGEGDEDGE